MQVNTITTSLSEALYTTKEFLYMVAKAEDELRENGFELLYMGLDNYFLGGRLYTKVNQENFTMDELIKISKIVNYYGMFFTHCITLSNDDKEIYASFSINNISSLTPPSCKDEHWYEYVINKGKERLNELSLAIINQ